MHVDEEQQLILNQTIDAVAKEIMHEQNVNYATAKLIVIKEFNDIGSGTVFDKMRGRVRAKFTMLMKEDNV
jgi:hypothetical protein